MWATLTTWTDRAAYRPFLLLPGPASEGEVDRVEALSDSSLLVVHEHDGYLVVVLCPRSRLSHVRLWQCAQGQRTFLGEKQVVLIQILRVRTSLCPPAVLVSLPYPRGQRDMRPHHVL